MSVKGVKGAADSRPSAAARSCGVSTWPSPVSRRFRHKAIQLSLGKKFCSKSLSSSRTSGKEAEEAQQRGKRSLSHTSAWAAALRLLPQQAVWTGQWSYLNQLFGQAERERAEMDPVQHKVINTTLWIHAVYTDTSLLAPLVTACGIFPGLLAMKQ
ncbi:unnamed protein product [Boreogadus saida]